MGLTTGERLRMYVGQMFHAADARVTEAEDPTPVRSRTGNIITIKPYWRNGAWVFDDPVRGRWANPFLDRSPEMVDRVLRQAQLPPRQSFVLTFADHDWPGVGYRFVLDWVRENSAGHWYRWNGAEALYPALVRYFDTPPEQIYCYLTARMTLSSISRASIDSLS